LVEVGLVGVEVGDPFVAAGVKVNHKLKKWDNTRKGRWETLKNKKNKKKKKKTTKK